MATATRRGIVAVSTAGGLIAVGAVSAVVADAVLEVGAVVVVDPERDRAMAWIARALLVLALSWLVIGMLSARTRLVRRPGAAAARASWIASTRPWRARESTLGMLPLDRWLMILVPGALLAATRVVQTSFLGWTHLATAVGGWLVFAGVVRIGVGRRSPWPVIAAVGGVIVMRCVHTLVSLSIAGPGAYWRTLWTQPAVRGVYLALAVALMLWVFVAAGWALSAQLGARRATGAVLAAVGAGVTMLAAVLAAGGPEQAAAAWFDELGLAHPPGAGAGLELPGGVVAGAAACGIAAVVAGIVLARARRRVGGRA